MIYAHKEQKGKEQDKKAKKEKKKYKRRKKTLNSFVTLLYSTVHQSEGTRKGGIIKRGKEILY